jgi:hypothetical protein
MRAALANCLQGMTLLRQNAKRRADASRHLTSVQELVQEATHYAEVCAARLDQLEKGNISVDAHRLAVAATVTSEQLVLEDRLTRGGATDAAHWRMRLSLEQCDENRSASPKALNRTLERRLRFWQTVLEESLVEWEGMTRTVHHICAHEEVAGDVAMDALAALVSACQPGHMAVQTWLPGCTGRAVNHRNSLDLTTVAVECALYLLSLQRTGNTGAAQRWFSAIRDDWCEMLEKLSHWQTDSDIERAAFRITEQTLCSAHRDLLFEPAPCLWQYLFQVKGLAAAEARRAALLAAVHKRV